MRSTGLHCALCKEQRRFDKKQASHLLHLLLTLITGGIWLPLWIWCSVGYRWTCSVCGNKRWW